MPRPPKIKKIVTEDAFTSGERAGEEERKRLRLARGRLSTNLTGGGGDTSVPLLGIARLSGGYGGTGA